jgi:uncharacterized membrane protein
VIRAFRINPEFEHSARTMECARHPALAFKLARVAQIDKNHVRIAQLCLRFCDGQRRDAGIGFGQQRLVAFRYLLRHTKASHRLLTASIMPFWLIIPGFSSIDMVAVGVFVVAWIVYHMISELGPNAQRSLNGRMHAFRRVWMHEMLRREQRVVDTTILASLQNGTAFFASTSLIAIGGSLALLQSADAAIGVFRDIPLTDEPTPVEFELKVLGLAVIFVYAFFKFAWSYRLFNYAAILMGAVPSRERADEPVAIDAANRAADMNTTAATHFNRGQRAFFFALAYLGWFLHAYIFIGTTLAALFVMWRRQYRSDALKGLVIHHQS